jgi:hypothetical protein
MDLYRTRQCASNGLFTFPKYCPYSICEPKWCLKAIWLVLGLTSGGVNMRSMVPILHDTQITFIGRRPEQRVVE